MVGARPGAKRFGSPASPYELGVDARATSGASTAGALTLLYPAYVLARHAQGRAPLRRRDHRDGHAGLPRRRQDRAVRPRRRGQGADGGRAVAWVGLDQHYFVSAVVPAPSGAATACSPAGPGRAPGSRAAAPGRAGALRVSLTALRGTEAARPAPRRTAASSTPRSTTARCTNLFAFFARILLYVMRGLDGARPQLGRRDHPPHGAREGAALPAHREVDAVDERDAEAAARDREAQGEVRRRPREAQPGDDAALPAAQGEPARRLPADAPPDADLVRALRDAADLGRALPRAVPLDARPHAARPATTSCRSRWGSRAS